jgi:hypothetical protein
MQHSAADADALAASLCAAFEFSPDDDVALQTADLLASLSALSLIERIEC